MATTTAERRTTTAMDLPVVYLAPDQPLAEVFVHLDGWEQLNEAMRALAGDRAQPRLAYAYELPGENRLLCKLVLDVTAGADEATLARALGAVRGLQVISIQPPAEAGLTFSELQRPGLIGTPAAIFGRPVIGSLTRGVIEDRGEAGERLLAERGREAGRLAASSLPPLLERLGITITDDLLARRVSDLQVMGWATVERASVEDSARGEVTLVDTFEAGPWEGRADSPTCHFIRGFITGVFSFAWDAAVTCREHECQGTGAPACRFAFQLT